MFERAGKHAFADMWMGGVRSAVYGGEMSPVGDMISGALSSIGNGYINDGVDNIVLKIVSSAVLGGTISEIGGGKFANGAVTGAYSMLFNDLMHGDGDEEFHGQKKELDLSPYAAASATLSLFYDDATGYGVIDDLIIVGAYLMATYEVIDQYYSSGNEVFPKPWTTDRPKEYIPKSINTTSNNNYFPPDNGRNNKFGKWLLRLAGGAAAAKKIYESTYYNQSDKTRVYTPKQVPNLTIKKYK